jgi:hypothetical protein
MEIKRKKKKVSISNNFPTREKEALLENKEDASQTATIANKDKSKALFGILISPFCSRPTNQNRAAIETPEYKRRDLLRAKGNSPHGKTKIGKIKTSAQNTIREIKSQLICF